MKSFNQKVYDIVKHIPYGMVINYGTIAKLIGSPQSARIVGYAMHSLPEPDKTPWHRVVLKDGSIPDFSHGSLQYKLLKKEGISFIGKKVDMSKHLWDGDEEDEENIFL
ncbi:MAG: MGMT family protein [Lactobacillus sp.]|jgi:methylated-DNA-protein-cysteine methyltransferase-like protein|nr:MGMT family protein [Lactobacillus sp.]